MANRSDRHLPNLTAVLAHEAAVLIEDKVRGFPSRPRASFEKPIKEAGYMNATGSSLLRPFTRLGAQGSGPYMNCCVTATNDT